MGAPILEGASVPAVDLATNADGVVVDAPITVGGEEFTVTCISMGNPHAIVFLPDLDALDFERLGPLFEVHPCFPKKINTEFVQVMFLLDVPRLHSYSSLASPNAEPQRLLYGGPLPSFCVQ